MQTQNNEPKKDYRQLRQDYPIFTYADMNTSIKPKSATLVDYIYTYNYRINGLDEFQHRIIFHDVDASNLRFQHPQLFTTLGYHLGLIEAFSYWKLTASPTFHLNSIQLHQAQLDFWHDLLMGGMSEYFYINDIDFTPADFVKFTCGLIPAYGIKKVIFPSKKRHSLVCLGGGKDSAVMLSLLTRAHEHFTNLIAKPSSPAADKQAGLSGQETAYFTREFDPKLKQYNQQGFLNGHVPFSASIAFASVLAAVLHCANYCLVGNESSADEDSLTWHDHKINHQYSKSTKFEQAFQNYCSQYLVTNVKYFSFLRPFNEFQIAQLFCTDPSYWLISRSCNRGQQQNIWCHHCAKCLFVYLLLAAFMDHDALTHQIFDHDLLDDMSLASIFEELLGLRPAKPLECVGTREESMVAFYLVYKKFTQSDQPLPALIKTYADTILGKKSDWEQSVHKLSTNWNHDLLLPIWAEKICQNAHQNLLTK